MLFPCVGPRGRWRLRWILRTAHEDPRAVQHAEMRRLRVAGHGPNRLLPEGPIYIFDPVAGIHRKKVFELAARHVFIKIDPRRTVKKAPFTEISMESRACGSDPEVAGKLKGFACARRKREHGIPETRIDNHGISR